MRNLPSWAGGSDSAGKKLSVENEKKVYERVLEVFKFEVWCRYQIRMVVRVFTSMSFISVVALALLTPTKDFPGFHETYAQRAIYGTGFLLMDLIEWYTIAQKFHWSDPDNEFNYKRYWYQIFSWQEVGKPKRPGFFRPLFLPWGVFMFTNFMYASTAIYIVIWNPWNLEAIDDRFQINNNGLLQFQDLRELCPP
jgi:hypothetical protein